MPTMKLYVAVLVVIVALCLVQLISGYWFLDDFTGVNALGKGNRDLAERDVILPQENAIWDKP